MTSPEQISTWIYTGPGAVPMMAAATAYANLAAEVSTAATQWESIITTLTTEVWTGAGSAAAAASATTIVSWLTTTAAALEQASTQATASAAAFETVFAAVVPPTVVYTNRATRLALVPFSAIPVVAAEIAELDALYAEYYAQDVAAMTAYQAASAAAGVLTPISPETPATNPGAAGIQAGANSQAAAQPATQPLTNGLSGLTGSPNTGATGAADPPAAAAADPPPTLADWLNVPIVQDSIYNVGVTAAWNTAMITATFPLLGHFLATAPLGVTPFVSDVTPLGAGLGMGTTLVGSTSGVGGAATAAVGEASAVGGLSVPASWEAAAPATLASSTAPLEGSGWTVAADEAAPVAAMPGMPGMAAAGKGAGAFSAPRYGFKPTVMPKQVIV
jgi:PPE-repeat protein